MHNNRETVIIPQTITVPTKSIIVASLLSPLRQMGICILNYLDDWLILAQSEAVSTSQKTLLLSHLCCLGLRVNFAKSILSPSQQVLFLGTVIDCQVTFIYIVLLTIQIVSKQLHNIKIGTFGLDKDQIGWLR